MQHMDQKQPCESIVSDNGNQIIDGCNQRTGSNCRINFDLVEKQWDQSADHTGNYHGYHQGKSNAAGNQKCMSHWIMSVSYTHLDVYKRQVQCCLEVEKTAEGWRYIKENGPVVL